MDIDLSALLNRSDALLLFCALAFGLLLGRMRIGGFELGATAGVLLVALLFGYWGFNLDTQTESLGFMLFIFCVGIEAGPNFFSNFLQDGMRYVSIALVVALTGVGVTLLATTLLQLDSPLAAGMLAGALTSTPTLVGAQDAVAQQMGQLTGAERDAIISRISVGYAMTYVIGLVGLLLIIRHVPPLLGIDIRDSARRSAMARGMDSSRRRNVRTPILRAYQLTAESIEEFADKTLRELGLYERSGLLIERIKRDGVLLEPDSETVLRAGDKIALVGYPSNHAKAGLTLNRDVYDPDMLEFHMDTVPVVVSQESAVGKTLNELELESVHGCLVNAVSGPRLKSPWIAICR